MRIHCPQCRAPVDIADDTPVGTLLSCGRCGYQAPYTPQAPAGQPPTGHIGRAASPAKSRPGELSKYETAVILLGLLGLCAIAGGAVAFPWLGALMTFSLLGYAGLLFAGKLSENVAKPNRRALGVTAAAAVMMILTAAGFSEQSQKADREAAAQARAGQEAAKEAAAEKARLARIERTAPARKKALGKWESAWKDAKAALLERGEWEPAFGLPEHYTDQEEMASLCTPVPEECETFEREVIEPIRKEAVPLLAYAKGADHALDKADEVLDQDVNAWVQWETWKAWRGQVEEPGDCPDAICTRERRRALTRSDRKMRRVERRADRALRKMACDGRKRVAAQLDEAFIEQGMEGTVRAEGPACDRLVWKTALCGRVLVDRVFNNEGLAGYEKKGFSWVGCKSYFGRHGYDLDPPHLEEQAILDAKELFAK